MKTKLGLTWLLPVFLILAMPAFGQGGTGQPPPAPRQTAHKNKKKSKRPGKEMASGGGDIGKGAAKGSADLGKGVAGGVGNLATGNVVGAGTSAGKGAAGLGKNLTVGSGKGSLKIGKGLGAELKKLRRKSKKGTAEGNP